MSYPQYIIKNYTLIINKKIKVETKKIVKYKNQIKKYKKR